MVCSLASLKIDVAYVGDLCKQGFEQYYLGTIRPCRAIQPFDSTWHFLGCNGLPRGAVNQLLCTKMFPMTPVWTSWLLLSGGCDVNHIM